MITYQLTEEKFTLDGEPYTGYGVAGLLDFWMAKRCRRFGIYPVTVPT